MGNPDYSRAQANPLLNRAKVRAPDEGSAGGTPAVPVKRLSRFIGGRGVFHYSGTRERLTL